MGTTSSGTPAGSSSAASVGQRRSDRSSTRLRTKRQNVNTLAKAKPAVLSHNQVEKKYRDRLNGQFQSLLAAAQASQGDPDAMDDDQRPLSKSAVLGLARRRLLVLEKENRQLTGEVERLTALLERIG